MIEKEIIKDLLVKKEYIKIINAFKDDYKQLLIQFSEKHHLILSDDIEIEDLILLISSDFPLLEGELSILSSYLFNPDLTNIDRIDQMMEHYNTLKSKLT